jgi:ribonuclease P protein component
MQPLGLSKRCSVKSKKDIETLFHNGEAFFVFPYKVVFIAKPALASSSPVQIVATAPKKKFKLAVSRNRIKRITKEAYRLQQTELVALAKTKGVQLQIMFMYTHTSIETYQKVYSAMGKILVKLRDVAFKISES